MKNTNQLRKVCFFPGTLALGGIGKVFVNLIGEFSKRGIEVDVYLTKREGEFLEQLPTNVRVFVGNGRALNSIASFIKYLRKEKPQAVISAREFLNVINILCCSFTFNKTKPVVSLHTNQTAENKASGSKMLYKNKYFIGLAKTFYKIPDKIIAVSSGVADDFAYRYNINRDKIKVIYNPVYDSSVTEEIIPNAAVEKFIGNGKKFIIGVGRLTNAKDFPNLIKAFSIVRRTSDISLLILGEGPLRKDIEQLIDKLSLNEHVLLPGFVNNPSYYIGRAAALVISSKFEGFGNVIVEGLGVGTPVVSTDCPSGPSEILDQGKYGKLVPVGDPDKLAAGIIETLNCTVDSAALVERAKHFSVSRIADEYAAYIMS